MLLYGTGIKPGVSEEAVSIADVAPTLGKIINVKMPEEVQGKVLEVVLKWLYFWLFRDLVAKLSAPNVISIQGKNLTINPV